MEELLLEWIARFSYPAVFALLLSGGFGAPFPEDLVLLAGGTLVAAGSASWPLMSAVAVLGVLCADGALFHLGRAGGRRAALNRRLSRVLTPARIAWVRRHLARYGALTVFAARFIPGMRAATFLLAGAGGMPRRSFFLADGLGVLIYAPLLTYLGHRFGLVALGRVRAAGGELVAAAALSLLLGTAAVIAWRRLARRRYQQRA